MEPILNPLTKARTQEQWDVARTIAEIAKVEKVSAVAAEMERVAHLFMDPRTKDFAERYQFLLDRYKPDKGGIALMFEDQKDKLRIAEACVKDLTAELEALKTAHAALKTPRENVVRGETSRLALAVDKRIMGEFREHLAREVIAFVANALFQSVLRGDAVRDQEGETNGVLAILDRSAFLFSDPRVVRLPKAGSPQSGCEPKYLDGWNECLRIAKKGLESQGLIVFPEE